MAEPKKRWVKGKGYQQQPPMWNPAFQNWIWPWQWNWEKPKGRTTFQQTTPYGASGTVTPQKDLGQRQTVPNIPSYVRQLPPEFQGMSLTEILALKKKQVEQKPQTKFDQAGWEKNTAQEIQKKFNNLMQLKTETGVRADFQGQPPDIFDERYNVDNNGVPLTTPNKALYYQDYNNFLDAEMQIASERSGERGRAIELLSHEQLQDIADRRDAERNYRIREFDQDKNRILAGLPSGVEGDVARYFVNKIPNAWRESSPAEITARQSATGIAERTRGVSAPGWLPEFVPGTEAGKPVGWGQAFQNGEIQAGGMPFVPTPSGQQLTKLSPSQVRWLSGAINVYGGRSWEDILSEAESMQPVTPRGAGQRRWNPSRQV